MTAGHITLDKLDQMTLDDIDDLNIVLEAEARAARLWRKRQEAERP